ncbi:hypothetical protein BwSH20_77550 [Bradyrhizobium ottawaense]|nr:hypothetical protein BwSH20_77550 [Bradyrhizobium ottawaense]
MFTVVSPIRCDVLETATRWGGMAPATGHSYGAQDKTVNLDREKETYLLKKATQRIKTSNGRVIIT